MTDQADTSAARARIARYLDERATGRGLDPDDIGQFNGHSLLVSDLWTLLSGDGVDADGLVREAAGQLSDKQLGKIVQRVTLRDRAEKGAG